MKRYFMVCVLSMVSVLLLSITGCGGWVKLVKEDGTVVMYPYFNGMSRPIAEERISVAPSHAERDQQGRNPDGDLGSFDPSSAGDSAPGEGNPGEGNPGVDNPGDNDSGESDPGDGDVNGNGNGDGHGKCKGKDKGKDRGHDCDGKKGRGHDKACGKGHRK